MDPKHQFPDYSTLEAIGCHINYFQVVSSKTNNICVENLCPNMDDDPMVKSTSMIVVLSHADR